MSQPDQPQQSQNTPSLQPEPAAKRRARSIREHTYRLMRNILHLWVKSKAIPDTAGQIGAKAGKPVCYVLGDHALSSLLILDKCCEEQALPRPLSPIRDVTVSEQRAYASLRRMRGILIRRPAPRRSSAMLRELIEYSGNHPEADIQLVPVTVFIGRAPDKETAFAKVLFTEHWEVGGPIRRFLSTLINGRDTLVQFSRPIALRDLLASEPDPARSIRKVSRILRVHFRQVRETAIGPDLSHRRTVIDSVLAAPAVRSAIGHHARKNQISDEKAAKLARRFAWEIAADYSYRFVRLAFFLLDGFLNRIYAGLRVHHIERLTRNALDHEVVYLPCHRSHIDYLLVSFILYENGFVPPHIAAGVNLKLPVIGALIRHGGAFYVRRTFRSQKLYAAVFTEYLRTILAQGVSIEYFIEGTRSRTGRLLPPRGGMLSMTVRGYLASPIRPIMFQPVYIGYEQMVEAESYIRELSGRSKRTEKLSDLLKVFGVLRRKYGEVNLAFGDPIYLDSLLDEHLPEWRDMSSTGPVGTPSLGPLVNDLGLRVMQNINSSADVNPVNLLATCMLATPKHAVDEKELLALLRLHRELLFESPLSEGISVTEKDSQAIVKHGFDLNLLQRRTHPLGDILSLNPDHAASLTYFRNNVAHLFAIPSLIACSLLNHRSIQTDQLMRLAEQVYPFLQEELFLPWAPERIPEVLQGYVDLLTTKLLATSEDGAVISRAEGGSSAASHVRILAQSLLPAMERYFITIAVLYKNGSGSLSRSQLEKLCLLTAERISQLHQFDAPEFSDRVLFRQFIAKLRELGYLSTNDAGALEFGEQLSEMNESARLILSKEIRYGIIEVAPQALEMS